jgi:hypothetical protein
LKRYVNNKGKDGCDAKLLGGKYELL